MLPRKASPKMERHTPGRRAASGAASPMSLPAITDRLTDDPGVDASGIEITVADWEVTLSGMVTTRFERRRAGDIVEAVSGVTHEP